MTTNTFYENIKVQNSNFIDNLTKKVVFLKTTNYFSANYILSPIQNDSIKFAIRLMFKVIVSIFSKISDILLVMLLVSASKYYFEDFAR